ncbi:hypothetical protein ACNKHV_25755 [Shigella flexneri]
MPFGPERRRLARELNIRPATLRYRCAGINHLAFTWSWSTKPPTAVT